MAFVVMGNNIAPRYNNKYFRILRATLFFDIAFITNYSYKICSVNFNICNLHAALPIKSDYFQL